ncbi:CubicO group peptidase, beta-lactamase class C family [Pedobacter steynii]|uniref:CubicO group peptidase, beta-lactamase class C family n=1 Tax=Pedobacter steynii TaxID=430522 RepID=A0A1G9TYC5_9SPHI|nr:serine hydrolase domain-containing protein [Pedobacter steynii]NQX40603.1 beta-lactamase family protein [Pedobacter steynii]SDM52770.1 CubicO group peptidase, beta-lactamase class C family [Pedobacter steynii]
MKRLILTSAVLCLFTVAFGITTSSRYVLLQLEPFVSKDVRKPVERARIMAAKLLEISKIPGLSIAVSQKGKIVYAEGFGYADLANKIPVNRETQFRTASCAKVITVTAFGKLLQEGKLDLNAGVNKYLPGLPQEYQQITPLQLTGHLSGLPHYADDDKIENRFYNSTEEALKVFSHQKLLTPPGTKYSYSTHGFTLLSALMEKVSGMTFLDYLSKELLQPLDMKNTGPDLRKHQHYGNLARLYDFKNNQPVEETSPEDVSYKWAGGGLISTPSDLVKLTFAYTNGFLKKETVQQMFKPQHLLSGEMLQIGIGWRISKDIFGRNVIEHAGGMEGARTVVCMFPDQETSVSLMVNASWSSSIEETAHLFAQLFMDRQETNSVKDFETEVITNSNLNGKEVNGSAQLKFKENIGDLTFADGRHYAIVPLKRTDVYGLISPEGIYYLEMKTTNQQVTAKAIAYGSQRKDSAIDKAPFLQFTFADMR